MADNVNKEKVVIDFSTNADRIAQDVNNLNTKIEQTTEATNDNAKAVEKQDDSYKNLKTQLKEANQELQKSIQLYGETSEQAINAAKGVAELKDQIGFAKDLSEQFNPDQNFKALGAASQIAATGIQGVTAGMALFGDQSEDTEKLLLKVQSAMAFSDAISGLSNLGDQWKLLKAAIASSSVVTKANTAATGAAAIMTGLFGGAVDVTSLSFKLLKGAIAATGIGLLVVGVVALINNFDKVKKVVLNFAPALAAVGEGIMAIVEAVTDFIGVTSEAERAIDRMRANADKSLALNKKFLDEHGSQLDEYTKQKIAAVDDYHNLLKEDGANQVALQQELNRKLAKIDQARQDEIQEKRDEAEEKRIAAAEKAAEKEKTRLAKLKEEDDKRIAKFKKEREEAVALGEEIEANFAAADKKKKEDIRLHEEQERQDFIDRETEKYAALKVISDKKIEDDKAEADAKKANQERLVSMGEQLIKNVASLAGKNRAIQKAAIIADSGVAIGKTVANTAEAVGKDLTKGFPVSAALVALDVAVGASSIASIVSGTSKALQAVGGGSGPSAPSLPSAPTGVNATPQTGFQASSENQISTSISKANQLQPIKTFVVASEVKDQQTLDAKLVNDNSFGG